MDCEDKKKFNMFLTLKFSFFFYFGMGTYCQKKHFFVPMFLAKIANQQMEII